MKEKAKKSDLLTGFVGGIHYSKKYPEIADFDVMQFKDVGNEIDWPNYNRRSALVECCKVRDAVVGYMDLKKDERELYIDDLKNLIWYSMVVLDEEKHRLNRKKAFEALGIANLFEKYL